ncbi:MAG: hypothetical protein KME06_08565 [Kastovskya adunca ATA6-11-RM4]|jgi:hypothetical protein|nr:hypothetical protein [Kastovskya adunca ATA6-11-RM4]
MEDFGIIVACCYQDYLFAKGCCASIRYFLGDVPICLIVDGTFSTEGLKKAYGVRVINHNNVESKILRERSFGWGKTKMIAFWESPWKHFLVLDADTNVWGNILRFANFKDFNVVIDQPCYSYSDEAVTEFFFDIAGIEKHFPDFNWRSHRDKYFCTGTFFATRGIFSLEEYIEILDFTEKNPGIFKYGEMGFLNFMLFRALDAGKIRLGHEDMQLIVPDFEWNDLEKRFPVKESGPIVQGEEATVIHWCGPKPRLLTTKAYAKPMNFCRRQFLQSDRGYTGITADTVLALEDSYSLLNVYKNKIRRKLLGKMKKSVKS